MTKTCPLCGVAFVPNHSTRKYCSDACSDKVRALQMKERYVAVRDAYRLLPKTPVQKTCAECGDSFVPVSSLNKYCSPKCGAIVFERNRKIRLQAQQDLRRSFLTPEPVKCPECGEMFVKQVDHQRYCSGECRRARLEMRRLALEEGLL